MRFHAILNDAGAIEKFALYVNLVNQMCKQHCCVKIHTEGITFLSSGNLAETSRWFSLFLPKDGHLFRNFSFAGFDSSDPAKNFIYFKFPLDEMAKIIGKGHYYHMKLKLASNNTMGPFLRMELQSSSSDFIVHEYGVSIVPSRNWDLYKQPNIGLLKMSICMPPTRLILKLLYSFKSMKAKFVRFRTSNDGEMYIESTTDQGQLSAYFGDLQNDAIESDSQEEFATVRLLTASIHQFYACLPALARVKLNTVTDRMAEFKTVSSEDGVKIIYVVSNMVQ